MESAPNICATMNRINQLFLMLWFCIILQEVMGWIGLEEELNEYFEGMEGEYKVFKTPQNVSEPKNITAFVPSDPEANYELWKEKRKIIASAIGQVEPLGSEPEQLNTARSTAELYGNAVDAKESFLTFVTDIANAVPGTYASFGPDNAFMIKEFNSLERKVQHDIATRNWTESEAVRKISDTIRGTIVTHDPDCLGEIIRTMKDLLPLASEITFQNDYDYEVVFKDDYNDQEYDTGYVGIHAKIPIALDSDGIYNTTEAFVLSELQVHLHTVDDGTLDSPKEKAHEIYEVLRQLPLPVPEDIETDINEASRVIYLFAMEKALKEYPVDGICSNTTTSQIEGAGEDVDTSASSTSEGDAVDTISSSSELSDEEDDDSAASVESLLWWVTPLFGALVFFKL